MYKFIKAILRKEAMDFLEKFSEICLSVSEEQRKSLFVCRVISSCKNIEQYLSADAWAEKVYGTEKPFEVQMTLLNWILDRQPKQDASRLKNDRHHHQRLSDASKRKFNAYASHGQGKVQR